MNLTGKKLISLFLVFSFTLLSVNLYAKRRGARLVVTKTNGQQIKGELVAVKMNTLLLVDTKTEIDISIDVREIKFIEVGRKSKIVQGMGLGGAIGSMGGMLIGATKKVDEEIPVFLYFVLPILFFFPNPERIQNM